MTAIPEIHEWLELHIYILYWIGGISLLLFIITMVAVPLFIINLPSDYLIKDRRKDRFEKIHFILRIFIMLIKNITGIILVIAGVLMLILPGQGILTILIGLILIDFPGKHSLINIILRNPLVLRGINWIRHKNNKKKMKLSHAKSEDT
jgi:hypothetical protein